MKGFKTLNMVNFLMTRKKACPVFPNARLNMFFFVSLDANVRLCVFDQSKSSLYLTHPPSVELMLFNFMCWLSNLLFFYRKGNTPPNRSTYPLLQEQRNGKFKKNCLHVKYVLNSLLLICICVIIPALYNPPTSNCSPFFPTFSFWSPRQHFPHWNNFWSFFLA